MSSLALAAQPATPAPVNIGPPPPQVPNPLTGEVELAEIPLAQADMVARAGSDTVFFADGQFVIDPTSRATLVAQAMWLLANPMVRARIEGHGESRGTRDYNLALGERRANGVRNFLVQQGVPAARLLTVSWGKERPAAQGSNEEAWAQNRRAVTVVVR